MKKTSARNVRALLEEIVFGVEDSLVSTAGALTGIAAGSQNTQIVILSGLVLIAAEALSMAAGSYLSSKAGTEAREREQDEDMAHLLRYRDHRPLKEALKKHRLSVSDQQMVISEVDRERARFVRQVRAFIRRQQGHGRKSPVLAGIVMGVCYLAAGAIPLVAYLLFPVVQAIIPSLIMTAVALFIFGVWKAVITGVSKWKSGFEMVVVAMSAAGLAYVIGLIVRMLLPGVMV